MSVNNCHTKDGLGVILFYGERLLVNYKGCVLKLDGKNPQPTCKCDGTAFLTSHRVLFLPKKPNNGVVSLSMPFVNMKGVEIKQPTFGANRIEGFVVAEGSAWQGKLPFSMTFNHGGAIEFGKALLELGTRANKMKQSFKPPPAMPNLSDYYACPPPYYAPPYSDPYYNFVPQHEAFGPPMPTMLYQTASMPPYPGATPPPYSACVSPPPVPQNGASACPPAGAYPGPQPPPSGAPYPPAQPSAGAGPGYPPYGGAPTAPTGYPPYGVESTTAAGYPPYGGAPTAPSGYPPYGGAPTAPSGYPPYGGAPVAAPPPYAPSDSPYQQGNTQNNAVNDGYYFQQDPHTVYTPSAPPATIENKKDV